MALTLLPGTGVVPIGGVGVPGVILPGNNSTVLDAANEAVIYYGHWYWQDHGSHTVDTSGSSKVIFFTGTTTTFTNGSSEIKAGLAPVDTATGPPGRASNTANVIDFDVACVMAGGTSALSANTDTSKTPTTGTKTIAHGDLVAFAVQMTARGGSDSVWIRSGGTISNAAQRLPGVTEYIGAAYSAKGQVAPLAMAIASDGTLGWIFGMFPDVAYTTESFASNSTPDERGNTFSLPVPAKLVGAYVYAGISANFDIVLYSDPLGTPASMASVSIDANAVDATSNGGGLYLFATPQTLAASTTYAIVMKPTTTTSNTLGVSTLANASAAFTAGPLGDSQVYASRTDGSGAFSQTTTKRCLITPYFSHFDNGVSTSPVGALKTFGRGAPY